jgi:hypothetical protein
MPHKEMVLGLTHKSISNETRRHRGHGGIRV